MRAPMARSIVIVEDDRLVRRAVDRALRSTGWATYPTDSATAALAEVVSGRHVCILSDHDLGGPFNGLQLLEHAAQLAPSCRRVLMSADRPRQLEDAIGRGLVELFLPKPLRFAQIQALAHRLGV